MKIEFGNVEIEASDLREAASSFGDSPKRRHSQDGVMLNCVDRRELLASLGNAVAFLLRDRLGEDTGEGGWGHSHSIYKAYLYGPEVGAVTRPSVMATVSAIVALQAVDKLMRRSSGRFAIQTWPQVWDEIRSGVNAFTKVRLDHTADAAHPLPSSDRHDAARYRHTVWWTRVTGTDFDFVDAERIARYVVEHSNCVQWKDEKTATFMAALSAFEWIERHEGLLGVEKEADIAHCRQRAQQALAERYVANLDGWTSGTDPEKGRQLYTLGILADSADYSVDTDSPLGKLLRSAMDATLRPPWRGQPGGGLPSRPGADPDVSVSCLGVSALMGRHRVGGMREDESREFAKILSFLVDATGTVGGWPERSYAWAVSYYVKDLCRLLLEA